MRRKISALLLALVMVLSLTLCVSAAENTPRLNLAAQHHGDEILVTVTLSAGEGITNGRLKVSYDPETLTLKDAQSLVPCGESSINGDSAGAVYLAWVGSDLETEDAMLQLVFQAESRMDQSFAAEATEAYAGETKTEVASCQITLLANPFTDIDNHWAKEEILDGYYSGLFRGVTATEFVPEGSMTRAMFVTVLHRMAGEPEAATQSEFTDVAPGTYYADAVDWAVETGVTNGLGNGIFAPEKTIDRQEMATMLYRYARATGRNLQQTKTLEDFVDANNVSDWAVDAMSWAVAEGILEGYPGNALMPRANATRAQAATVLCRYLGC